MADRTSQRDYEGGEARYGGYDREGWAGGGFDQGPYGDEPGRYPRGYGRGRRGRRWLGPGPAGGRQFSGYGLGYGNRGEGDYGEGYYGAGYGGGYGYTGPRQAEYGGAGQPGYGEVGYGSPPERGGTERWWIPGPHTGRGPRTYQRSDDRIREDVCERLTQHGQLDATDIEVKVKQGEVTLTGTVDSRRAKRVAEDTADTVQGVKDVHNQLRVQQPAAH